MEYPGFDWSELGVRFGLITPEQYEDSSYDEDELLEGIKEYISSNTSPVEDPSPEMVRHLKEHLTLLIERDCTYNSPLWRGLLGIENHYTFCNMCIPLIEYMWD